MTALSRSTPLLHRSAGGLLLVAVLVVFTTGRAFGSSTWGEATPAEFDDGVQNTAPSATFTAVSCASAGNCTAAGYFSNADGAYEAFTMTSTDGDWGQATPAEYDDGVLQSTPPEAFFNSVSCASAGNCTAVGRFRNADGYFEAFTMTSTDGDWGQATRAEFQDGRQRIPPDAVFNSVSCGSAGNCTAVGQFKNALGNTEAFTMTSTDGDWGQATPAEFDDGVQNTTPNAVFTAVSCASAGNCTAAGYFSNPAGAYEAFTMTSTDGDWGQATPAEFDDGVLQSTPPDVYFNSVSCGSAGNCTAVGFFRNVDLGNEAFTMTSTDGDWGQATPAEFADEVQHTPPYANLNSVSCASAGYCTAAGVFANVDNNYESFTMTSTDGVWGQATPAEFADEVQNNSPDAAFNSVSCASAGNCTAVGVFANADGNYEAFTMTSTGDEPAPSSTSTTAAPSRASHPSRSGAPSTTMLPEQTSIPSSIVPVAESVVLELPVATTPMVVDGSFSAGADVTVTVSGFAANEYVQMIVASTPQVIGSGHADARGEVTLSGTLPVNLASGSHTLAVYAPGSETGFRQSITVSRPSLPVTGGDSDVMLVIALCAVVVGLTMVLRRRTPVV